MTVIATLEIEFETFEDYWQFRDVIDEQTCYVSLTADTEEIDDEEEDE